MTQAAPIPDQTQWYYMHGQQRLGPVTTDVLQGMMMSGAIDSATLVWHSGLGDWTPLGALPQFAFALQAGKRKEAALGLTTAGLVVFIILLVCCVPLCWLPWVIDGLRAKS